MMLRRSVRIALSLVLVGAVAIVSAVAQGNAPGYKAPPGKMLMWAFGQPQFLQLQFDDYFRRFPSEVQGVKAE
ncbi:MAG: hypothetical protein WCL50_02645, partial [Spirochaetota bacterium]